jgi:hypothetical protein
LIGDHRRLVGGVLSVDQNPVEPGVEQDLGGGGAPEAAPEAHLLAAGCEGLLELVDGKFHGLRILGGQSRFAEIATLDRRGTVTRGNFCKT